MKKLFLLISVALLSFAGVQAAHPALVYSTSASHTYYRISFGSNAGNLWQDNGGVVNVSQELLPVAPTVINADQEWRVEASPTPGCLYLISKAGGYLSWNAVSGRFFTAGPNNLFTIKNSTSTTYPNSLELAKVGINGAVNNNAGTSLGAFFINQNSDALTFTFVETVAPTARELLNFKILAEIALRNAAVIGVDAGQYPQGTVNGLSTAITTAQEVYNNAGSVDANYATATAALTTAEAVFKGGEVLPVTVSTDLNPVWYYIQGAAITTPDLYSYNQVINVNPVTNKVSWDAPTGSSDQLFRFERVANSNTVRIINMLSTTGGLSSATSTLVYSPGVYSAYSLPLTYSANNANGLQYSIVSRIYTLGLYTGTPNTVGTGIATSGVNTYYNSSAAFKFTPFNPAAVAMANNPYLEKTIAAANALLTTTLEGTKSGNFSTDSRATLQAAIDHAQAYFTAIIPATPGIETKATAITLQRAMASYLASPIQPTVSVGANEKWYTISRTNLATAATATTTSMVAANNSDSQLWKVVANTNGTANGFALVNKAYGTYLNTDGLNYDYATLVAAMPTKNLNFFPSSDFVNNVNRFNIFDSSATSYLTSTYALADNGSAFLWNFTGTNYSWLFTEQIIAATKTVDADGITVKVVNNKLEVTGTDAAVRAFAVTGAEVDATKALNAGIYIVKVAGKTVKVSVR